MNPQHALVVSTGSLARQLQSSTGWAWPTGAASAAASPTDPSSIFALAAMKLRKRRIVKGSWNPVEESSVFIMGRFNHCCLTNRRDHGLTWHLPKAERFRGPRLGIDATLSAATGIVNEFFELFLEQICCAVFERIDFSLRLRFRTRCFPPDALHLPPPLIPEKTNNY